MKLQYLLPEHMGSLQPVTALADLKVGDLIYNRFIEYDMKVIAAGTVVIAARSSYTLTLKSENLHEWQVYRKEPL